MELHKIISTEERNEDELKGSELMLNPETEALEEAESEHYSKLQSPSDDVYSEAYYHVSPDKPEAEKQAKGNIRLYRAVCLFLAIICLALLLVVVILGVKFQTGSTACPESEVTVKANRQSPVFTSTCSFEQCQAHFPSIEVKYRPCPQCAPGWLTFDQSCYYLSTSRLSWDESQKNCSIAGGSLAVISSPVIQHFLTGQGKMEYWIGLRQQRNTWKWIDQSSLQQSYWADVRTDEDCAILSSGKPPEKNWVTASCQAYTYFICQMKL